MTTTRNLLLFILSVLAGSAGAQQFYLHTGMDRSDFLYKNTQGESLDGMHPQMGLILGAGLRGAFKPLAYKWFYTVGVLYENYGTLGTSPDAYRNYYEWRTTYLGLDLGVQYDLFTLNGRVNRGKGMTFFLGASVAPEFLIKGEQTINSDVYDLRGAEQFDAPFLFLRGTAGVNYCISNRTALMVDYTYGHGVRFPGVAWTDDERLAFQTHNIRVGVLISFPSCRYCISSH